jgi:hypothetical protein
MFNDFFWTPFIAGLEDGVNPCLLMNFSVVLLGVLWFKRVGINRLWIAFLFAVMMASSFAFNCGFLDRVVLSNYFQMAARALYLLLAVIVAFRGVKFLQQWFSLIKGKSIDAEPAITRAVSPVVLLFVLFIIGFLLSMVATLWPINAHVMTFSVYMLVPGNLVPLGSLVLFYSIVSCWFVGLAIPVSLLEKRNPRLFKIVAAAFLLAASLGIIDIILMKG